MSLFFLEDFSEKLIETYISKSVEVLTKTLRQKNYEEYEEVIYKYKKRKLLIWCNMTTFQLVFINEPNHGVLFSSSYDLENLDNITQKVLDVYIELTSDNQVLECCENCTKPFYSKVKRGDTIENHCYDCDIFRTLMIRKYIFNPIECNICYVKNVENIDKNENNKIKYTEIYEITCCKDKYICINCVSKLTSCCSCNILHTLCPFCKQDIKIEEL